MNYKIYYNGDKVKLPGFILNSIKKVKHIWPEDTTELEFSVEDGILYYSISNLSDRTRYLFENDLLALGLFVIEERAKYSGKNWRSAQSIANHSNRKYLNHWHIDSLEGEINIGNGPYSSVLGNLFMFASEHHDPYREDGYDNLYIGIGRDCDKWTNEFRPHKISDSSAEVWCDNPE